MELNICKALLFARKSLSTRHSKIFIVVTFNSFDRIVRLPTQTTFCFVCSLLNLKLHYSNLAIPFIFFINGMPVSKKLYGNRERRYKYSEINEKNENRKIYIENREIVRLLSKSREARQNRQSWQVCSLIVEKDTQIFSKFSS